MISLRPAIGLGVLLLLMTSSRGAERIQAPAFVLKRFDGTGDVALGDYRGRILVLDFFAHWCVPCRRASTDLEGLVRRHYLDHGHPAGLAVDVLSINVESGQRSKTEEFIRRNRVHTVVDDTEGSTLQAYGGRNLPFIVVIDGTAATVERPDFRILYRREGFEGAQAIRNVIDRVQAVTRTNRADAGWIRDRLRTLEEQGALPQWAAVSRHGNDSPSMPDAGAYASTDAPLIATETEIAASHAWSHQPALTVEGLLASDIQLSQSTLTHTAERGDGKATVTAGWATMGLDYQPVSFDFLGYDRRIDENRLFIQGGLQWRLHPRLTALGGAGYYDGYTDYRSAWLAEYYRQQFSTLPGYASPTPSGHQLSAGMRLEYIPATAFVQLNYSYLVDEIAPGYEIDFDGLRQGRPFLYTHVFQLSFENVVSRRLRVLHELRRIDTSDRDLRIGYQGSANLALGERWVVRVQGGAAAEEPNFDAWHAGATLDVELDSSWSLQLSGRYYEDSGEIENSNFSNAAPPLKAWQVGLGVRYSRENFAVRVHAAPYATRYGDFGIGTAFFQNLYRNRDWGLVQVAMTTEF